MKSIQLWHVISQDGTQLQRSAQLDGLKPIVTWQMPSPKSHRRQNGLNCLVNGHIDLQSDCRASTQVTLNARRQSCDATHIGSIARDFNSTLLFISIACHMSSSLCKFDTEFQVKLQAFCVREIPGDQMNPVQIDRMRHTVCLKSVAGGTRIV